MINTKESAKELRKTLKKMGVKASVRSNISSISVYVKNFAVDLKEISKVAKKYQSISRCPATDEILSGANTYVNVSYDYDFRKEQAEKYRDFSENLIKKAKKEEDEGTLCNQIIYKSDKIHLILCRTRVGYDLRFDHTDEISFEQVSANNTMQLSEQLAIFDNVHNLKLLETD
jgi:hypothetical protein